MKFYRRYWLCFVLLILAACAPDIHERKRYWEGEADSFFESTQDVIAFKSWIENVSGKGNFWQLQSDDPESTMWGGRLEDLGRSFELGRDFGCRFYIEVMASVDVSRIVRDYEVYIGSSCS